MRTRISTTVDPERLATARSQTGLLDSELIDLALAALIEQRERDAEDQAFSDQPFELDPDLTALPTGWPPQSPPLDTYDEPVPSDVIALFAARHAR
jgi:hypothetical protein